MKNLFLILLLIPSVISAQNKVIIVQGNTPDLYITHTTGAKESFYSIGRIYNSSPKVFAPYNNLALEKGLAIGQVVKIPLDEINFSQDGSAAPDEVLIPVYHKVKPKETLYNISTTNNKVPVTTLKKWNKLTGDAVSNGSNMIVGYLKVKKELSPLAGGGVKVDPVSNTPQIQEEIVVEKPVKKTEPPVITKKPDAEVTKSVSVTNNTSGSRNYNGGIFKSLYQKQNQGDKTERGTAGTFKSTSGWQDGKYYCLHNTAPAGTIIKITNPVNQRSVFAKVLDIIPDIKQNEGMLVRLSNAAADELGAGESFECEVNY